MEQGTFRKLAGGAAISASLLVASSFLGSSSAWAAPSCAAGSVAAYTAPGFACSVGPLTFSHFVVVATGGVNDGAANAFNPDTVTYMGHSEYGFSLGYAAAAGPTGTADVLVTYDVTSAPQSMIDAYMAFSGGTIGDAYTVLSETLSNGSTMLLTSAGATGTTFSPTNNLSAIKDQEDIALDGLAFSSVLVDGFSVTGVPEPGTIALFGAGLLAAGFALRRRRLQSQ